MESAQRIISKTLFWRAHALLALEILSRCTKGVQCVYVKQDTHLNTPPLTRSTSSLLGTLEVGVCHAWEGLIKTLRDQRNAQSVQQARMVRQHMPQTCHNVPCVRVVCSS